MFDNNIVSVIIPVYNAEQYIRKTIESVLQQTYPYLEVILIDDCSQDNSRQIIEEYRSTHNSIVLYCQARNCGAAIARNQGLKLAKGRFVAFLDSDDLWDREKLTKQLSIMAANNVAFCYTSYEMIDDYDRPIKSKIKVWENTEYKHLLKRTLISTPTVVLDRQIIGEVEMPPRRTGQDYAYWLALLRKVGTAYGIDEALVKVRKRDNSLSSNKLQSIRDVWVIQTTFEKINPIMATYNTFFYIFYAIKKRFF